MPKNSHLLVITFPGSVWSAPFRALADQVNKQEQKSLAKEAPDLPVVRELLGSDETATPLLLACELNSGILEIVAKCRTHTQTLVLFEDPRTFLSSLETRDDLPQLLKTWSHAAHMSIAAHRKSPGSMIIVSAEEARESPEAFIRFAGELHPACLNLQAPASDIDPVRHVLAHAELASLSDVLASARELEASCRDFGSSLVHSLAEARLAPAWEEWSKQREAIKLPKETAAVMDSLKSSLGEMKEENELLLVQLHQVQEKLERHFLENKRLAADNQDLEAKHTSLVEEHSALVASSKEALEENELLLLQLHQVQEELEHYFLENRKLSKLSALDTSLLGRPSLAAETVRIGASGGADVHRHLDFHLDDASLAERHLGGLDLRLVEHHGRPGLLIFGQNNPPLHHWVANGQEGEKPYMLVIPQDKAGSEFLKAATTSDLFFLQGATNLLMKALNRSEPCQETRRWLRVAEAFLDRCGEVPKRLHYDDVQPRLENPDSYHFRVIDAFVSGRHLPELCFAWSGHSLELELTSSHQPPMTCWPLDHDGRPVRKVMLDLGRSISKSTTIPPVSAFSATDKLLLWHLVNELPNFIEHIRLKNPNLEFPKNRLHQNAKHMRRNARSLALS